MNRDNRHHPPRIGERLLYRILPESERRALIGDYEELFEDLIKRNGRIAANLWYWIQITITISSSIWNSTKWSFYMLTSHIKTTFRNQRRSKTYSIINISGLATGLICCMFIFLWVYDEWSYDRFHANARQIYRAVIIDPNVGMDKKIAVTPIPLATAVKNEIPEITHATRISQSSMRFIYNDDRFEERGLFVSPDFLNMFSLRFVQRNTEKSLTDLNQIVISERVANRIFGTVNPIGRILGTERGSEFKITGVFENIPSQSHLRFDYLLNFRHLIQMGRDLNRWSDISFYTYVIVDENANNETVSRKLTECHNTHLPEIKVVYQLQPLTRIYLDPPYMFDMAVHGSRQSVIAFSLIAVGMLIIACINFINLSTARAARRSTEIGLRKVMGARRSHLVKQFLSESFMMTITAALLAIGGLFLFLPAFNTLVGKQISIAILINGFVSLGFMSIILFTGVVSGTYPSLYLSSFQPVRILKEMNSKSRSGSLRKLLIILQYTLTITVLIGVLIVEKQLRYMRRMDLGYDEEHLLVIPFKGDMVRQYESLKQELLKNPNIINATATANLPMNLQSGTLVDEWEGRATEEKIHLKILWVEEDYLETFRMEMIDGQFFSKERSADRYGFVLNQTAVNTMGLESPVGKRANINMTDGTIIGVVKDFHFRSLHHAIEPMVFIHEPSMFYNMVIRLVPNTLEMRETIQYVETLWKRFAPDQSFTYSFFDDRLNRLYRGEQLMGKLFRWFSGLTIFIACIGLLGLASFTAEQKIKEIGLCKVLGASVAEIILYLCRGFTKWVLLANFIAWPIAYYFMNKWLQNFTYRTSLSVWIFILSGLATLVIALATVSYQTIKAATANPVEALRYE